MIWIKEITEVIPFRIKLLFSNGEEREISFDKIFEEDEIKNPESVFLFLKDPKVFMQVKLNPGETIYGDNLVHYIDLDGSRKLGPLDISPDFLYEMSVPVSKELIHH